MKSLIAAMAVVAVSSCLPFTIFPAQAAMSKKTVFTHAFAPSDPIVSSVERPYRESISLNGRWQFQPVPLPAGFKRDAGNPPDLPAPSGSWEAVPIKIPSPWNVNTWGNGRNVGAGTDRPYTPGSAYYPSYPETWDHTEMGWLRRTFQVPAGGSSQRIVLHFDAVAGDCEVRVNGHVAAHHFDSFLPFDADITDLVKRDAPNELLVGIRGANLFNKRSARYDKFLKPYPDGSTLDGIIGIWQDVTLTALPAVRVDDVFVQPLLGQHTLKLQVAVRNDSSAEQHLTVGGGIQPWINLSGKDNVSAPEPKWKLGDAVLKVPAAEVTVAAHSTSTIVISVPVHGELAVWSPDTPRLYGVVLTAKTAAGAVDRRYTRFGWRQLSIHGRDLLLNGKKIQLFGDISHPFGPFMMSRRYAWAWYHAIKDWGGNAVRLHAQPYPRCYQDMADEMGIMLLDEDALFGSSIALNLEEPQAWERFDQHFDDLVRRDRNHPSVFGWSFGNEMFAVLRDLAPEDTIQFRSKLVELGKRALTLDPTRPWISCDGDKDLEGGIPTWSAHFGHGLSLKSLPDTSVDKPLMVGESGGTYYARPEQMAEFNGDKAYESYAGRNDALGIDVYQNLVQMARPYLSYFSASETMWFGLEHLNYGYADYSRLPGADDGIFFGPYVEGQSGMQLERIPPYVGTLNPGWDPSLPLYKPLGMFNAMKAALHQPEAAPCAWDHLVKNTPRPAAPAPGLDTAAFAGDMNGELYARLYTLGVPFVSGAQANDAKFLIVDGRSLTADALPGIRDRAKAITARGGTVLIMVNDAGMPMNLVNSLLPSEAKLTARQATMLVHKAPSPWVDSYSIPDLYFAEDAVDRKILKCGIGGAFADRGKVLLTAGNTDWSLFNDVGEIAKCGAVVLYEHLQKPGGAALVTLPQGQGTVALSSIDYAPEGESYAKLWRSLLSNMGLRMHAVRQKWVLPTADRSEKGTVWRYTTELSQAEWSQAAFDDSSWKTGPSGFGGEVPGGRPRTPWSTGDIWIRTDFDMAAEDIDALKLAVHHDEDVEVYVNGVEIYHAPGFVTQYEILPLDDAAKKAFKAGKNTVAVHCHQTAGGQYIDVGFLSGGAIRSSTTPTGHDLLLNGPQE